MEKENKNRERKGMGRRERKTRNEFSFGGFLDQQLVP